MQSVRIEPIIQARVPSRENIGDGAVGIRLGLMVVQAAGMVPVRNGALPGIADHKPQILAAQRIQHHDQRLVPLHPDLVKEEGE